MAQQAHSALGPHSNRPTPVVIATGKICSTCRHFAANICGKSALDGWCTFNIDTGRKAPPRMSINSRYKKIENVGVEVKADASCLQWLDKTSNSAEDPEETPPTA